MTTHKAEQSQPHPQRILHISKKSKTPPPPPATTTVLFSFILLPCPLGYLAGGTAKACLLFCSQQLFLVEAACLNKAERAEWQRKLETAENKILQSDIGAKLLVPWTLTE